MVYIEGTGIVHGPTTGSLDEMVFSAASAALRDAGCTVNDIDGICLAASDQLDGRAISSMLLAGPAGGYLKDEIKVTEDSSLALAAAAIRVEAGAAHRVLAVSWSPSSESDPNTAVGVNVDPVFARPIGAHPMAHEGMEVGRYCALHRLDPHAFDAVATRMSGRPSLGQSVALPLHEHHIPPATDGAVAVVVTAQPTPVELAGFSWAIDPPSPASRSGDPGALLESVVAAVLRDAGEGGPWVHRVETTDRNVFRLGMVATALGLTTPADVARCLAEGELSQLNPSGGLWTSNPIFAAGLERIAIAAQAIRNGEPGVLCHSSYGVAGQGQFVSALKAA